MNVVRWITAGIKMGFWILSLGWLNQSEDDRRYADIVRKACKRAGLDYYPVLLSEPETCAICGKYVGMLVQPRAECWPCWRFHVQETHRLILVAPGERPQSCSLAECSVQSHIAHRFEMVEGLLNRVKK